MQINEMTSKKRNRLANINVETVPSLSTHRFLVVQITEGSMLYVKYLVVLGHACKVLVIRYKCYCRLRTGCYVLLRGKDLSSLFVSIVKYVKYVRN